MRCSGRCSTLIDYENDSVLKILSSIRPISMSTFNDRLRLQKLGYLAQELGAGDTYYYSWYAHGPYSSPLTTALFTGVKENLFTPKPTLTNNESKVISLLKSLLGRNISNASNLELFASIWYLLPFNKITEKDKEWVLEVMCKEKPHFTRQKVKETMAIILDFRKSL